MENQTISKANISDDINAYVFIQTDCGCLDTVLSETKNIEQVMSTAVISGNYDVLIKVNVRRLEDLFKVSEKIKMIKGISQATTHIIEKEIINCSS